MSESNNRILVSVIMSAYNEKVYIGEAIQSVLNQTFKNFEFIIVNDCSTDGTLAIIEKFIDKRIKLINNEMNLGLTKSLNRALELATGKYIARMDADDWALPHRLDIQVNFMEDNPEIGVCGSWFEFTDNNDVVQRPQYHDDIAIMLMRFNPIAHPTVMIRKSVLDDFGITYDENFISTQDYELWARLLPFTRFANIPEVLLKYRRHGRQISQTKSEYQLENTKRIRIMILSYLDLKLDDSTYEIHENILLGNYPKRKDAQVLAKTASHIANLLKNNRKRKVFNEEKLQEFLKRYWSIYFSHDLTEYNVSLLLSVLKLPFPVVANMSKKTAFKFIWNCLTNHSKTKDQFGTLYSYSNLL